MQGLIDALEVFLFVLGPVFYQVVHAYLDDILNEHPYNVVCPNNADQRPWKGRNQPAKGTHENRKDLGAHDGAEQWPRRKRRHKEKLLAARHKEHEMPACYQLQEQHGLKMGLIHVHPLLPFRVLQPLPSDEKQAKGLCHGNQPEDRRYGQSIRVLS